MYIRTRVEEEDNFVAGKQVKYDDKSNEEGRNGDEIM
jgi:hypothetical protein